jgi:hypothetical protein
MPSYTLHHRLGRGTATVADWRLREGCWCRHYYEGGERLHANAGRVSRGATASLLWGWRGVPPPDPHRGSAVTSEQASNKPHIDTSVPNLSLGLRLGSDRDVRL